MTSKNNIPKHWGRTKASEVGKLLRGVNYKKEEASTEAKNDYLPILRGNNINGELNFEDLVYVKQSNISKEQLIKAGDIVFAMSSGSKHLVGKSAKAKVDFNGSFGAFCGVFRPNELVNRDFVAYFFQSPYYKKVISEISKGTNINNLKREHILDLDFPLPPLSEQQAIVAKIEELLSELDNGKQQLLNAQQQLKVYRQSLLKWAFEGKEKTSVGELFDFIGGGTPSKKNPKYWQGEIPWASVKDVKGDYLNNTQDRISKEGLKDSASNLAKPNDVILITRISPGKTIITKIETAINQDLKIVKPKFETTPKFIFYVFKSIEWECVKKSSGTTVLGINLTNLKEIKVPKISIEEQRFIVSELESKLTVCDKIEETISQSLQQTETLRQSILKKAFEGKLINTEKMTVANELH